MLIGRGQILRDKGDLNIGGPALTVGNRGRQQLHDPRPGLLRRQYRATAGVPAAATTEHGQGHTRKNKQAETVH